MILFNGRKDVKTVRAQIVLRAGAYYNEGVEIKCSQCGAAIAISPESGFITCPYCDSRLYLETGQTVAHSYLKPALKPEQVPGALVNGLAELELNRPVSLTESELVFVPFWEIKLKDGRLRFPASQLELAELGDFSIPAGAMVPYDAEIEQKAKVEMPEVGLDKIMHQPGIVKIKDSIEKADLVHVPFYKVVYKYGDESYSAMVDAGAGKLYADKLPVSLGREKDRYFLIRFGILSAVFLLEAFFVRGFWLLMLVAAATGATAWYLVGKDIAKKGY